MSVAAPVLVALASAALAESPHFASELIFPLHPKHNHAPGVVELPGGGLLVSWYRGSGERKADDVAVYGARRPAGGGPWSEPFLMVDTPGFPDGNTCMMIDRRKRLWLFWPIVLANTWESVITHFLVAEEYEAEGCPKWIRNGPILLKPDDFEEQLNAAFEEEVKASPILARFAQTQEFKQGRERAKDKLYQRLGWQPRCKPTVLSSGRILLPLYSDTFSVSIMAVSDDDGETWYASKPLIGFGNIQPVVLERKDETLVAYMRENGPRGKIRVSESADGGIAWSRVVDSELLNPGAGIDGVRLANGNWLLVYNDLRRGRHRLAVSISDDEGRTWKWTRRLENQPGGSFHYPCVVQGADGLIHVVYSYFVPGGKSMKHAEFNEAWVREGDPTAPETAPKPSDDAP